MFSNVEVSPLPAYRSFSPSLSADYFRSFGRRVCFDRTRSWPGTMESKQAECEAHTLICSVSRHRLIVWSHWAAGHFAALHRPPLSFARKAHSFVFICTQENREEETDDLFVFHQPDCLPLSRQIDFGVCSCVTKIE